MAPGLVPSQCIGKAARSQAAEACALQQDQTSGGPPSFFVPPPCRPAYAAHQRPQAPSSFPHAGPIRRHGARHDADDRVRTVSIAATNWHNAPTIQRPSDGAERQSPLALAGLSTVWWSRRAFRMFLGTRGGKRNVLRSGRAPCARGPSDVQTNTLLALQCRPPALPCCSASLLLVCMQGPTRVNLRGAILVDCAECDADLG